MKFDFFVCSAFAAVLFGAAGVSGDKGGIRHNITRELADCKTVCVDFSMADDGTALSHGDYVQDEWLNDYGMTIDASTTMSGYTPNGMARIYDTLKNGEDPDLGSPNKMCGGHGVGAGGEPDGDGPNCNPKGEGNVLVIQESDKPEPDDNAQGGIMTFSFDPPVHRMCSISLIDVDAGEQAFFEIYKEEGGAPIIQKILGKGGNSIQKEKFYGIKDVNQVSLVASNSFGVRSICFCPGDDPFGFIAPPPPPPPAAGCGDYKLFETKTKTPLQGSCNAFDQVYKDLCPTVDMTVAKPEHLPPGGSSPTCKGYCCGSWSSGGTCPNSWQNTWRKAFPGVIVPECDGKEQPGECEVVLVRKGNKDWPDTSCSVGQGNWIFPSITCWTGNDLTSKIRIGVNTKVKLCNGNCHDGGTEYIRTDSNGPKLVKFPGLSDLSVECIDSASSSSQTVLPLTPSPAAEVMTTTKDTTAESATGLDSSASFDLETSIEDYFKSASAGLALLEQSLKAAKVTRDYDGALDLQRRGVEGIVEASSTLKENVLSNDMVDAGVKQRLHEIVTEMLGKAWITRAEVHFITRTDFRSMPTIATKYSYVVTRFLPQTNTIFIRVGDEFKESMIMRKFGRAVLFEITGKILSTTPLPYDRPSSNEMAWDEGWASLFSCIMRNDPVIDYGAGDVRDLGEPTSGVFGADVQENVEALLWTLLSRYPPYIFWWECIRDSKPTTLRDYLKCLFSRMSETQKADIGIVEDVDTTLFLERFNIFTGVVRFDAFLVRSGTLVDKMVPIEDYAVYYRQLSQGFYCDREEGFIRMIDRQEYEFNDGTIEFKALSRFGIFSCYGCLTSPDFLRYDWDHAVFINNPETPGAEISISPFAPQGGFCITKDGGKWCGYYPGQSISNVEEGLYAAWAFRYEGVFSCQKDDGGNWVVEAEATVFPDFYPYEEYRSFDHTLNFERFHQMEVNRFML